MPFKRGLWLVLEDHAGETIPIAADVTERRPGLWVLEGMAPPQVYPTSFVAAHLRLDGEHLARLVFERPLVSVTHQPLDIRLEFPIREELLATMRRPGRTLAI